MKDKRIKMLKECIDKIKEVQGHYMAAMSGWTLLQGAGGHIMALHHLESMTNFSDEIIGVKNESAHVQDERS